MLYRLLHSTHRERRGSTVLEYNKGDVFESDLPLCDLFPNKFQQITPGEFKIAAGVPIIQTGDLHPDVAPTQTAVAEVPEKETEEEDEDAVETNAGPPLGEDVSIQYPIALDHDLRVFAVNEGKTTRYQVTSADDPQTPLNEAPLTVKGLEKFLASQEEG